LVEEEVKRRLAAMMGATSLSKPNDALSSDTRTEQLSEPVTNKLPDAPIEKSPDSTLKQSSDSTLKQSSGQSSISTAIIKVKPEAKDVKVKTEPISMKLEPHDDLTLDTLGDTDDESHDAVPEPMPALDRTLSQLSVDIIAPTKVVAPKPLEPVQEDMEPSIPEPVQDDYFPPEPVEEPVEPLSAQLDPPQEQSTNTISLELPPVEHLHAKSSQTSQEERDRYRKQLSKGLKVKHDGYLKR
jgi:hypothetical protein